MEEAILKMENGIKSHLYEMESDHHYYLKSQELDAIRKNLEDVKPKVRGKMFQDIPKKFSMKFSQFYDLEKDMLTRGVLQFLEGLLEYSAAFQNAKTVA